MSSNEAPLPKLLFGNYLNQLLIIHHMKQTELAELVGYQDAYISRIVRNRATPRDWGIVHVFADALKCTVDEREELGKALIRSWEEKVPGARRKGTSRKPLKPKVFRRDGEAVNEAIKLLEELPDLPSDEAGSIIIKFTVQGYSLFRYPRPQYARWTQERLKLLGKGYSLRAYWRLDDDPGRCIRWVRDILSISQAGKVGQYVPYYFTSKTGLLQAPHEVLLIPASHNTPARALLFLATDLEKKEEKPRVDGAFSTEDPTLYKLLEAYLERLIHETIQPLLKTYDPVTERPIFLNEMWEAERQSQVRRLVKRDLAVLTLPLEIYDDPLSPWVLQANLNAMNPHQLRKSLESRQRALEQRNHYFRDICSKRALVELTATNRYASYQSIGVPIQAEPRWVQAHIQNAIELLEKNDNFEIALVDEKDEANFPLDPLWMVAGSEEEGKEAVFIEALKREDEGGDPLPNPIILKIEEPRVVKAFKEQFELQWQQLVKKTKAENKREVIKQLRSLLMATS